jgi:hypothetical protein
MKVIIATLLFMVWLYITAWCVNKFGNYFAEKLKIRDKEP